MKINEFRRITKTIGEKKHRRVKEMFNFGRTDSLGYKSDEGQSTIYYRVPFNNDIKTNNPRYISIKIDSGKVYTKVISSE